MEPVWWHLPNKTARPPTGRELIEMPPKEFGVAPKVRVLNRPMLRVPRPGSKPEIGELYEMLYQKRFLPTFFDSTKFAREIRLRRGKLLIRRESESVGGFPISGKL